MFDQPDRQQSLFREEAPLSTQYTPEEVVGREAEIDQLVTALQPIARRQPPDHVLVHGPAGVGKTTTVDHVCRNLEEQTRVVTVFINCWQYNTRASLLSQLLIGLGYPAPRKGNPVDELLAHLREWLDKNQCVVAVLDEFDRLRDQTEIAYDLQHVASEAANELGLVLISNQPPSSIELDMRSESRLSYRTIPFRPYDQAALAQILKQRATQAFRSGTVTDEAVDLIAARVAEQDGDCRSALELLHRAGRIAEQANHETVTPTHVEQSDPLAHD